VASVAAGGALAAVAAAVWLLAGAAAAQAAGPFGYTTEIRGVEVASVRKLLLETSRLVTLEKEPPPNVAVLRRRAQRDLETMRTVLRSEGYYGARVEYALDRATTPVKVVVTVQPGPAYVLAAYDVVLENEHGVSELARSLEETSEKSVHLGERARSAAVVAHQDELLVTMRRHAFALARVVDRQVVVDHATREVRVTLTVDPGPELSFGMIEVEGASEVETEFIRRRAPWRPGASYDVDKLADYRTTLLTTGLFDHVRVRASDAAGADDTIPIVVTVTEAKFRGIGIGVFYSSSDGGGADAFWENRNFRGKAERLRIGGTFSEQTQEAKLAYRKPDFLAVDQALNYDVGYKRTETDAYDASQLATSIGIERGLVELITLRAGVSFEYGPVDGALQDRSFHLLGLPLELRRLDTDSLLDPTAGSRIVWNETPYQDLKLDLRFLVSQVTTSFYVPLSASRRFVLASRASVGSLVGAQRSNVPSDKLFYTGGGGSVRGYSYQKAGPLASDNDPFAKNDPLGGRSLVEVGTELRVRVSERIGLVPFVDGGNVYQDVYPSFTDDLFWGAGLGFRYFTSVGPLRLDLATPLRRRSGIDDPVQFYISLGQAF